MASPLANAIEFLRDFGLFDVVLPFLLVFTIVFAILEKSMILGKEKGKGDSDVPAKNLNSIVAFVVALLVVASANIVGIINESLPNIILLVVISLSFLLLISIFLGAGELNFKELHGGSYKAIIIGIGIAVLLIFLAAIKSNGQSWLSITWDYVNGNFQSSVFASVIFLIIVIIAILLVVRRPSGNGGEKKEGD
jgi:hypothetical protein